MSVFSSKELLNGINNHIDINTALMRAVENNHIDIVEQLFINIRECSRILT